MALVKTLTNELEIVSITIRSFIASQNDNKKIAKNK